MDDDLIALRRAAAAHPDDPDRLRAVAVAQERAGLRWGAFLNWCDLARRGDGPAQQRVLGWSPWPEEGGLGRAGRARRPAIEGDRPQLSHQRVQGSAPPLALASDEAVVGWQQGGSPGGWSADAVAWRYQGHDAPEVPAPPAALCGDRLAWIDGQRLFLLDARRGTLHDESDLGLSLGWRAATRGDRLVALGRGGEEDPLAVGFNLATPPGWVLWRTDEPPDPLLPDPPPMGPLLPCALPRARRAVDVVIGGPWAYLALSRGEDEFNPRLGEVLAALRVETGVPYALPGLSGPPLDPQRRVGYELLGADEQGLVACVHPGQPQDPLIYLVDARTGALRWSRPLRDLVVRRWGAGGGALGPAEVVLAGFAEEGRALRIDVLERRDGALRWSQRLPLEGPFPPHEHAVALADGVLYFAWTAPEPLDEPPNAGVSPTIHCWELDSGRERFRVEVPFPERPTGLRLIPRAHELLIEVSGARTTVRGRLSE